MESEKVALVTGSGKRRVGSYVVDALAAAGYRLAIHYRSSREDADERGAALRGRGIDAVALPADLRKESDVHALVDGVLAKFGRLDVLVNCAAIWKPKPLEETTADDLRENFEINTLGTFLCCQRAGLAMVKQTDGGCIVNVGDWAASRPYPNYAAYFVSKGAIPTLTRDLAVEFGTRNPRVRVNCVLPGPVMLPPDLPEAERQQAIDATLVKREGDPRDIAQAVLYLVQAEFVTGVCLPVDGGRTIFAGGN